MCTRASPQAAALKARLGFRPNVVAHESKIDPKGDAAGWAALVADHLAPADAVLSLLPAPMHADVARACIDGRTALVTASYVADEVLAGKG